MFQLSNKAYDIMKWAVGVVMPALAFLYAALAGIWGWPHGEDVVTTAMAIATLLGSLLQFSSANYNLMLAQTEPSMDESVADYPFQMSGDVYETLKWLSRVALPAIAIGYSGLAAIWGWPYSEGIGLTLTAVVSFLNAVLGISSMQYQAARRTVVLSE